jgi:hypothetical protein
MHNARTTDRFAALRTFASLRETPLLSSAFRLLSASCRKRSGALLLAVFLLATCESSLAQSKKKKASARKPQTTLNSQMAQAKADLVAAAKNYKDSLEKLLVFQEADVKTATETLEKRKALLSQNIISKKEVEESEHAVVAAESKVNDTKKQIGESDNLIAEASAERQLEKLGPSRLGAYQATAALIRYNGPTHWALSDASKVEVFFAARFNHALPISAFGQTAVHDHLGFDHRNAMDVALSPDSSEGKALMDYLRSQGIPFIAFHYAVAGSATGAHIHIGLPSRRLGK